MTETVQQLMRTSLRSDLFLDPVEDLSEYCVAIVSVQRLGTEMMNSLSFHYSFFTIRRTVSEFIALDSR